MSSGVQDPISTSVGTGIKERVSKTYSIDDWGFGYFGINSLGRLQVTPHKIVDLAIDVFEIVSELVAGKQAPPFLLRFPQILDERLSALHQAFAHAITEFEYTGLHLGVYPVKVNQRADVVRRLVEAGRRYNYGLEVGSKAELVAALAMPLADDALITCNGLKDQLYLRTAILAEKLGRQTIIIVEDIEELEMVLGLAEKLEMHPNLGIRVKLYARGSGKWEDSGGEFAKFGMSTVALVSALDLIESRGASNWLKMLHFHIGSQINDIRRAKQAFKEAARVYAKTRQMGFEIGYLNVGGGLGVDYDGSKTASEFSMNYSVQEFANDVIHTVGEVCSHEKVPPPTIVTEHGRAMVAYHSMLIADVRKVIKPGAVGNYSIESIESESAPVVELRDIATEINAKNFREYYHDAVEQRADLISLFELGYLGLKDKAKGEWLFWRICTRAAQLSRSMKERPVEFDELERLLASKYVCNFSMFQSLPDFWAFDQLFPILPIHRLNELPSERGVLCDITCDSDGSVDKFVDTKTVKESLELHALRAGEPYYLGFLMLGAYQETLGDLHNLFGAVTSLSAFVEADGTTRIERIERGDNVRDVLADTGHEAEQLREVIARQLSDRRDKGLISDEDEHEVLATTSLMLDDYTYLD
jgi:arginine decarboxylase